MASNEVEYSCTVNGIDYYAIPIDNVPNNYVISMHGKLFNVKTERFLGRKKESGYIVASIKGVDWSVAKLVATTFLENPKGYIEVRHLNNDKTDNNVDNLCWASRRECVNSTKSDTTHSKRVLQYKDNILVAVYDSMKEAEEVTGINRSSIGKCCNGTFKVTDKYGNYGGPYIWKYMNEENNVKMEIDEQLKLGKCKEVTNYPGYYIFEDGKVYSSKSRKFLKIYTNNNGYSVVQLCNPEYVSESNCKGTKEVRVHRLVALHFLPKPRDKEATHVDHIDSNKSNCHVSNLEWVTPAENNNRMIKNKLKATSTKSVRKLTDGSA